jgi:hypothetical protein
MRKILGVAALMLAFCCPALAGEMPTPPVPQQPQGMTAEEPTGGEMPNLPVVSDSLTQIALDLLAALPSLL